MIRTQRVGKGAPDGSNLRRGDAIQVFVSYSRKDVKFVDRLERNLKERGIQPLVDRDDIANLEDWWARVASLIVKAHTVLFVLSPDWLSSKICRKEFDHALQMQKRLAPVLCRPLLSPRVPPALARLNWVSLNTRTGYAAAIDSLIAALETDIEWIREQARISEQAGYWDRDGRADGALLRDEALFATERWLARRPTGAPPASKLLADYLRASREVYEREETARKELLDRTLTSQSRMLAERASQELEKGDAVTAILLCLEALPDDDAPVKRPFVASAARVCFNALYHLREERVFALPDEWTWDLAVSDDGRRLMTHATSGARVLDMASGKEVANLEDKVVIVSTDAALAVTQHGKHVRVWSLSSAGEVPNLQRSFDLSPAKELGTLVPEIFNAWMVYGGRSCAFEVVRSKPGHAPLPLRSALPIKEEYECASFSSNGERIVTTPLFDFSFPTTVSTWNARTGRKLADLKGHKAYVRTAEFSADGARVATGAADRTARVWDAESGKQLVVLKGHEDDVTCARFSPDGSLLVTASYDGSFRVWNLSQRSVTALLRGHVGKMPKTTDIFKEFWPRARFTPDGRQVMTIWKDRTARLWNLEPGKILQQVLTGHGRKVNSVSFHPDGKKFATVSDDKTVLLWDAKTKMQISTWARLKRAVRDIAFSPDGTMLAAAVGNELVLWSTESQQEISRIATSQDICKIAFSPEGSRVVMTFLEEAGVWNLSSRKRISTFNEGGYDARFSPSGLIVASCGDERAIRLWNAETGREIGNAIFQGHSLLCIAFDREGQRVLVGSDDHTARIWKIMTEPSPETVITLSGHDQGVNSAEFNAAGTLVVTASQDNTVRLWDSATGEMLAVFEGHSDNVLRATFSPSGDQIVSVSADRSVRIWQLFPTTQALIDYAKKVVARVLTPDQRKQFFLDPDPPAWYGKLKKWPYS